MGSRLERVVRENVRRRWLGRMFGEGGDEECLGKVVRKIVCRGGLWRIFVESGQGLMTMFGEGVSKKKTKKRGKRQWLERVEKESGSGRIVVREVVR